MKKSNIAAVIALTAFLLRRLATIAVVIGISTAPALAKNKEKKSAPPPPLVPFSFMGLGTTSSTQDLFVSLDKAYAEKTLELSPYGYSKETPDAQCRSALNGPNGQCMLSSVSIAGVSAQYISYQFEDDHLASIMISTAGRVFYQLKDILIAKYGEPTNTSIEEYTNGYGAKFKGQKLRWDFADGVATYAEISSRVDNSTFSFTSNAGVNKQREERNKAMEKAKGAL